MPQNNRDRVQAAQKARRAIAYEVGEIPEPANWARRNACEHSLTNFIRTYRFGFDKTDFQGELFPDQLEQIADVERAISARGCYAFTDFRGGGKTSIITAARTWLLSYGHAGWIVTLCASQDATENAVTGFIQEIQLNEVYAADFPELSAPMIHCEGKGTRVNTQTCEGVPTRCKIGKLKVVLPDVSVSATWQRSAGAVCEFSSPSSTGLRGKNLMGARPDVVFFDDIESDKSVESGARTDSIEQVLSTVAGLGSHFRDVSCIWIGTIIANGCLMDRYSDPLKNPSWHGKRFQYLKSMPIDEDLWDRYVAIRKDNRSGGAEAARAFYRANMEAMRAGAEVAWPEGYDRVKYEDALEKFYATKADKGTKYVACELQNNPSMMLRAEDRVQLDQDLVMARTNGLRHGAIPDEAVGVVAFVDVQDPNANPLYWIAEWFNPSFGGGLHSYGTWPLDGQTPKRHYERLKGREIGRDELLSLAMEDVVAHLKTLRCVRQNGTALPMVIGADSGDGVHQSVVFALARQQGVIPTKGVGLKLQDIGTGRNTKALSRGQNWYTSYQTDSNGVVALVVNYESRRWKSFARDRLQAPLTSPTAWTLWGGDGGMFQDLARHFCSERSRDVSCPEGTYTIWQQFGDNHWWDGHTVCHALASHSFGLSLKVEGGLVRKPKARKKRKFRLDVAKI